MLYYTLWFGESQHLFLIFFIFIFFIFCIFIWCNFVQCFFYFWQRISDLGCLIVDAAVYTVEISSEWTGFSFFQVFFLPFPIFGRFLVRSWACAWTNQTFTYHFTFLFSLFIIWKQADQFPDQPEKNLIHNKCQADIRNPLRYVALHQITAPQFIRRSFHSSWYKQVPHPLLIVFRNWSRGLTWFG